MLWIIQAILAIKLITVSYSHGLRQDQETMKQSAEKMGTNSRIWHTLIAILALIAALGLILPGVSGFWTQLTLWAAGLTALMMLGSIYFHVIFRDKPNVFVSIILFILAVFVAYGRLAQAPF